MIKFSKTLYFIIFIFFVISCTKKTFIYEYPKAPSEPAINIYHGDTIIDLYRNFENLEDSIVLEWMKNQKSLADSILNKIPGKDQFKDLQKKYNENTEYRISYVRRLENQKIFYLKKNNGEKLYKLYYRNTIESEELLLFDPEVYNKKINSKYNITYIQPDWNGDKIAIALVKEGDEIGITLFLNVLTKNIIQKPLKNTYPSFSGGIRWLPDNKNILYMEHTYTDPKSKNYYLDLKTKLYNIQTNSAIDIFSFISQPQLSLGREDFPRILYFNDYDKYVLGEVSGVGSFKDVYVSDIESIKNPSWKLLYTKEDMVSSPIIKGDYLYFISSLNNPNKKICRTLISNPDFKNPEILIPEDKNNVIYSLSLVDNGFVYVTQKNGIESNLFLYLDKKIRNIKLPRKAGDIYINTLGVNDSKIWITYSGWTTPAEYLEYNIKTGIFKENPILIQQVFSDFDNAKVEEIEVIDNEGVAIPLSLIYNKDIELNGENPTIVLSYGSYGTNVSPFFFPSLLIWINKGGILAFPHVRGGGEKGDAWHKGGFKTTKPNSWKDAITCTEYLIENKYTSPKKLISWGSSAGGIVGARTITERPELYTAAILDSPAINMLRCENQPNGQNSIKEFGTVAIEEEYKALLEMDAYHQIKEGVKYPSTLIFAGLKDGRVAAWDPAKFIAKLQSLSISEVNPVLFDINFEEGHSNASFESEYELYARVFSFALWQTGHPDYQLKE